MCSEWEMFRQIIQMYVGYFWEDALKRDTHISMIFQYIHIWYYKPVLTTYLWKKNWFIFVDIHSYVWFLILLINKFSQKYFSSAGIL